ncbi:fatty acid desaturase-domain-containing protein [Chytriomyces cf. hyalinus JEL632]|nr:fatty acid desaturase-domain-containing protein [Chytriomyces cf. hyalinus JEL632]
MHGFDPLSTSKFGRDLKERVREYFQNLARKRGITLIESTKASPAKCRLMASLAVMWAVSLVLLLRGNYSMLFIHPLMAWIFTAAAFHDALHFALSTNPTINSVVGNLFPYLASPFGWYHQHVIGHHPFTNIPNRDPDLLHGSENSNKAIAQYLPFDARLALFFMTATSLGLGLQNELFLVLGMNIGARFAFSVVPHAVYSTLFMINSQVNHQSEATKSARSRDWFVHQVITAQNFGDSSVGGPAWWFHYLMSGGLCLQMEHHLFPTVNHCHLPAVAKIVKQVCYEHGVPYTRADGYGQALAEYYRQEKKESKSLSERKVNKSCTVLFDTSILNITHPRRNKERECADCK